MIITKYRPEIENRTTLYVVVCRFLFLLSFVYGYETHITGIRALPNFNVLAR
jgi:hypothetical protein